MLIGKEGPVSQEQIDKMAADAAETKRIKSFSDANLAGEIRRQMRTAGKVNPLCFALGLVALTMLTTRSGHSTTGKNGTASARVRTAPRLGAPARRPN